MNAPAPAIRTMGSKDLESVLAIEQASFGSPWTFNMLQQELNLSFSRHLVISQSEHGIVGYIIFWIIHDETQLQRIAVKSNLRGQGIGSLLIREMIRMCALENVTQGSLEVRSSNDPALLLYKKFGFGVSGIRKGYYTDNGEDALIMTYAIDRKT
jgi:ribosomal-protein-alanine N-acetyltransferase